MSHRVVALILLVCGGLWGQKPTLYSRIGGYDTVAVVAVEFLKGIRSDPRFARFTGGRSADSLARSTQMLKDQLCTLTGGPCTYPGRDMKTAHSGLGISSELWTANMGYMAAALDKAGVKGADKAEILAMVDAMKGQIVEPGK